MPLLLLLLPLMLWSFVAAAEVPPLLPLLLPVLPRPPNDASGLREWESERVILGAALLSASNASCHEFSRAKEVGRRADELLEVEEEPIGGRTR